MWTLNDSTSRQVYDELYRVTLLGSLMLLNLNDSDD